MLTAASSSNDYPSTQCGGQETLVLPLAEMVTEQVTTGMTLVDVKDMLAAPELFGRPDLDGLHVYVNTGCRPDETVFFGLNNYMYVATPSDPVLSCCVGTDCGAEVACEAPGAQGLPTTCDP